MPLRCATWTPRASACQANSAPASAMASMPSASIVVVAEVATTAP